MSNEKLFLLILGLFGDFRGFLRPCFAMRRVKKQQIKVKFWILGPRTVYYNTTCAQKFFKNHSTLVYTMQYNPLSYRYPSLQYIYVHNLLLCMLNLYFLRPSRTKSMCLLLSTYRYAILKYSNLSSLLFNSILNNILYCTVHILYVQ